jgi:hypothetical protein
MRCCPPCPYGPVFLVHLFWVTAGLMYTLFATFDCDFVRVSDILNEESAISFGTWTIQDYNGVKSDGKAKTFFETDRFSISIGTRQLCILWPKHEEVQLSDMDLAFRVSRYCLLTASVLSILLWFWILQGGYERFANFTLKWMVFSKFVPPRSQVWVCIFAKAVFVPMTTNAN